MATNIKGATIASTYDRIVVVDDDGVDINSGTATKNIEIQTASGVSTGTPLHISTTRVGIGIAAPAQILHVQGSDPTIMAQATGSNDAPLSVKNDNKHYQFRLTGNDNSLRLFDETAGQHRLTILSGGNVGIGTTSPTVNLEVAKTDDEPTFKLTRMDNSISSGDSLGKIQWSSQDADGTSDEDIAGQIQVLATETHDGGNFGTKMLFYTADNTSSVLDPRLIIHNDGNVAIGTANANRTGYGANARVLTVSDHGSNGDYGVIEIAGKRADNGIIGELAFAHLDGSGSLLGNAFIRAYRDGNNDAIGLKFLTEATSASASVKMTLDSAGKLIFPASSANDKGTTTVTDTGLHRYSEGHHIYTITGSASGSMTPRNDSSAMYTEYLWTRVGRMCFISGKIEVDTDNSLSGTVKISIPFTSANIGASTDASNSKFPSNGMIPFQLEAGGTDLDESQGVWGEIEPNTDYMQLYYMHETGSKTAITDANVDSAFSMWFSGNYVTDGN